jgi:hypothetical protein
MKMQIIEMDTNKIYSIMVEVGDMKKQDVVEYLEKIKTLYEALVIKAVYCAMRDGIPFVTINEVLPESSWTC